MLVTCPECATRYEVDDSAFSAGGRAVRCNHCGCEWYQIGPAGAKAANPARSSEADGGAPQLGLDSSDERSDERSVPADTAARPASGGASNDDVWEPAAALDGKADDFKAFRRDEAAPNRSRRATGERSRALVGRPETAPTHTDRNDPDDVFLPAVVSDQDEELRDAARKVAAAKAPGRSRAFIGLALVAASAAVLVWVVSTGDDIGATSGASRAALTNATQGDAALAPGIVLVDSKYALREKDGVRVLEVWGLVANNSDARAVPPVVEVISRDSSGRKLQSFFAKFKVETLEAGQRAAFAARLGLPIEPIHDVNFYIVNR